MAFEVAKKRIRWGVALVVAAGVALGVVLADIIYEMRTDERTGIRIGLHASEKAEVQPPSDSSCTDGIDCYCDCIENDWSGGTVNTANDIVSGQNTYANSACQTRGVPIDSAVLYCSDYEQQTFHDDLVTDQVYTNTGGQSIGRPVWSDNGWSNWRGYGGAWSTFLNDVTVAGQCAWHDQEPSGTVLRGNRCNVGGNCSGVVHSLDPAIAAAWQTDQRAHANTCIAFVQSDEIDNEITDIQPLTNGRGSVSVFDGIQMMAHRIAAGHVAGFAGDVALNGADEIGVAWAMAYPSNLDRSGILRRPWKPNEWRGESGGSRANNLFTGCGSGCPTNGVAEGIFPMVNYIWYADGCAGKLLTCPTGNCYCGNRAMVLRAEYAQYDFDRDWGLSTWGCIRGHVDGLNTSSSHYRMWFNNTLVVEATFNPVGSDQQNGVYQMKYGAYSNANQDPPGSETTEVTYRYEDNLHIRAGEPYTCSQIGFN